MSEANIEVEVITSESVDTEVPEVPEMTAEEIAALEAERKAAEEELLRPAKEAAQKRNDTADIVAEHDDLMAEMLYEMSLKDVEE